MAEGSIPRVKAQIAVIPATKCQLCEIHDIQFKCFTCEEYTYMCNGCKIAHKKSRATQDHKITSTKGADRRGEENIVDEGDNKCRSHPSEDIVMFCKQCRSPVCMDCIAGGSHQHHKLTKIQDMIEEKQREIAKIIDEANKNLSTGEHQIKSIRKMSNKYSKDVTKCIEEVKARNVQLKSMLDQITNELIKKLQRKGEEIQDLLKRKENVADSDISMLKEMINNCTEQQKNRETELVRFVTDVRNKLDQLQLSDAPSQPNPPVFITKDIDMQILRILFGDLDPDESEKGSDYERSTEVNPTLNKPTIDVKIISTFAMEHKDLVAAVSDTQAWVGEWNEKGISLVTSDGKLIQTVKTDFDIYDMAVTTRGELLVTVNGVNNIKKMKLNGKFTDVYVSPSEYVTKGITITDDNHIIVGLYDRGNNQGKLVKLSPNGTLLQTIQYDSTDGKTPLFGKPWSVSCNRNGDFIVISDGVVDVVDKTGCKRSVYKGKVQGLKKSFDPQYTVTDNYGHILISDYDNHAIHLLDSEGKFLQFVLTDEHQLSRPYGMSIDKSGNLWVCSHWNSKVMVVKYV